MTDARHKLWKVLAEDYDLALNQVELDELIEHVKECLSEETFLKSMEQVKKQVIYSQCTCDEKNVELCNVKCENR